MKKTVSSAMRTVWVSVIGVALWACSPQKYYQHGHYHEAAVSAIYKLQRNPHQAEYIRLLQKAYPKAVEKDKAEIEELRRRPSAESYERIYQLYQRMEQRQDLLETVLPLRLGGKEIEFPLEDFKTQRLEAEKQLARYYYDEARKLLASGSKADARKALEILTEHVEPKKYWFPQFDALKARAERQAVTRLFVRFLNESRYKIPSKEWSALADLPWAGTDPWFRLTRSVKEADVHLVVRLTELDVGRIERHQKEYVFSAKDSAGERTASVTEHRNVRRGRIAGMLQYRRADNQALLQRIPFEHEIVDERTYYAAVGDLSIVPADLREKVRDYQTMRPLLSDDEMRRRLLDWLTDFVVQDIENRRQWIAQSDL